jgi:hypothetical protein
MWMGRKPIRLRAATISVLDLSLKCGQVKGENTKSAAKRTGKNKAKRRADRDAEN